MLVVSLLDPLLEVSEEGLDVLVLVVGRLGGGGRKREEGKSAKRGSRVESRSSRAREMNVP